jgi:hypothetical protein
MKGVSEQLGLFLKLVEIAFICTAIVAVFFTITSYNVGIKIDENKRQAMRVGESLMGCTELNYAEDGKPVYALFDSGKLKAADDLSRQRMPLGCVNMTGYLAYFYPSDSTGYGGFGPDSPFRIGNLSMSGKGFRNNMTFGIAMTTTLGASIPGSLVVYWERV